MPKRAVILKYEYLKIYHVEYEGNKNQSFIRFKSIQTLKTHYLAMVSYIETKLWTWFRHKSYQLFWLATSLELYRYPGHAMTYC